MQHTINLLIISTWRQMIRSVTTKIDHTNIMNPIPI